MIAFLRMLWFRIRSRLGRTELDAELAEELKVHRALLEEEARCTGISEGAAQRAAALRLGNTTAIRERTRDAWSFGRLEAVAQDLRYAVRFLRRSPGFTTVAVVSLALGIGANAAVFTVVDRLLLSPPPHVADAGHLYLVNVRRTYEPGKERPYTTSMMFPESFALLESGTSFSAVVPYTPPARKRLGRGPDAPRIKESMVAADFFSVLGVRPERGRFFIPDDDTPDKPDKPAVISFGFWERQFARADSAIGSRLTTTGVDFVVVGVAPEGFTGVELDAADIWVPLGAAASAEATVILNRIPGEPNSPKPERTVQLGSVIPGLGPSEKSAEVKVSTRLAIASVLVLLAACANLANLLLVRALGRRRAPPARLSRYAVGHGGR